MKLSASLQNLANWYEVRPLRERVLLLICLLVVLFFLWDSLVMNSIDLRKKAALIQSRQTDVELMELTAHQQLIEARKDFDPDQENRLQLQQLQGNVETTRKQLEETVANLISPQDMPGLLKELLVNQKKLQLIKLENQPAEVLQIGVTVAKDQLAPALYRHRLQLEFSGSYLATLSYLKTLESLPRQMVWEQLDIETQQYPQARVRLQVYTLSLSKGWIGG